MRIEMDTAEMTLTERARAMLDRQEQVEPLVAEMAEIDQRGTTRFLRELTARHSRKIDRKRSSDTDDDGFA